MKSVLVLLFLTATALAQDQSRIATAQAACGPKDVQFDVKNDPTPRPASHADPDKATLYIIGEDTGIAHPTIRVAVDGAWVGATHTHAYFSVPVEPGEHHLCASGVLVNPKYSPGTALAHLTAEAGKAYYFRTRVITINLAEVLDFEAIDSDQGKLLIAFILSASRIRKTSNAA